MSTRDSISLRLLSPADSVPYRKLRLKSLEESPLAFSDCYEDETLKDLTKFAAELEIIGTPPESFVLGAFTNSEDLIAMVKFKRDQRLKGRHKAMIHNLYVDVNYREKGLGKKLMQFVSQQAKSLNGLEQIHLWVLETDTSVAAFYESCGFLSQGTLVKQDLKIGDHYVDARYMVFYL